MPTTVTIDGSYTLEAPVVVTPGARPTTTLRGSYTIAEPPDYPQWVEDGVPYDSQLFWVEAGRITALSPDLPPSVAPNLLKRASTAVPTTVDAGTYRLDGATGTLAMDPDLLVTITGTGFAYVYPVSVEYDAAPVVAQSKFTGVVSVTLSAAGTMRAQMSWYRADGSYLAASSGPNTAVPANGATPTQLVVTDVAPDGAAFALVQPTAAQSFTAGTTWRVVRFGVMAGDNPTWSAPGPQAVGSAPPSAPTLTATAQSSASIVLSWTASTDDTGIGSYRVRRDGVTIADTVTGRTFTDLGLTPSTAYAYTVSALDMDDPPKRGPESLTVTAITQAAPVTAPARALLIATPNLPAGTRDPVLQPLSDDSMWNLGMVLDPVFEAADGPITTSLKRTDVGRFWVNGPAYSHQMYSCTLDDPCAFVSDGFGRSGAMNINPLAEPAPGTDRHMHPMHDIWVDELIGAHRTDDTHWGCSRHILIYLLGKGMGPLGGSRAYGGSAIGGLIRTHEVDPTSPYYTGRIDHALALAHDSRQMLYTGGQVSYDGAGYGNAKGYVWPATEQDSNSPSAYKGLIPMGALFAIPGSVSLDSLNLSTPEGMMVAVAAQDRGGYSTDTVTGTSTTAYIEKDAPSAFRDAINRFPPTTGTAGDPNSDWSKIVRAMRHVTSNTEPNLGGGPIGAPRRGTTLLPLPPRSFFRPTLPAGYTAGTTAVGAPTSIGTSFATTLNLPYPTGVTFAAGDWAYILAGTEVQRSAGVPAGWTPIIDAASNGYNRFYAWCKQLVGGETGSVPVTSSGGAIVNFAMFVRRGVDPAEPFVLAPEGHSTITTSTATHSLAVGPIEFTKPKSTVVTAAVVRTDNAGYDSDGAPTYYQPTGRLKFALEEIPDARGRGRTLYFGQTAVITGVAAGFTISPATGTRATKPTPFTGRTLYVDPNSSAAQAMNAEPDATRKALLKRISDYAVPRWYGEWIKDATGAINPQADVAARMAAATSAGRLPIVVLYCIVNRDNGTGGFSSGGSVDAAAYRLYVDRFAAGIGNSRCVVVVEPDALAQLGNLTAAQQTERLDLIRYAVSRLAPKVNTTVYLDAGNSGEDGNGWIPADVMASRLLAANISAVRGFAMNVSNFKTTAASVAYAEQISARTGGRRYVVDTSRNGLGPYTGGTVEDRTFNPPGRALGDRPLTPYTATPAPRLDAQLWLKIVGESDGPHPAGAPAAGTFYTDWAVGAASRATWGT